jgi:hypothetical protein
MFQFPWSQDAGSLSVIDRGRGRRMITGCQYLGSLCFGEERLDLLPRSDSLASNDAHDGA